MRRYFIKLFQSLLHNRLALLLDCVCAPLSAFISLVLKFGWDKTIIAHKTHELWGFTCIATAILYTAHKEEYLKPAANLEYLRLVQIALLQNLLFWLFLLISGSSTPYTVLVINFFVLLGVLYTLRSCLDMAL